MECRFHEGKEAAAVCVSCKTPVCDDCRFELNGKSYCRKCATAFIEDIDTKLKLEIPTEVTCVVCGRTETTGLEPFYVCSRCGEVVCEGHWYGEESYCEVCYDLDTEFKVDESRAEGLTRPCPTCGTDNLLDASRCRNRECGSILTPLIDAEEIRKKNIPCGNHADRLAYVQCVGCGKYLCLECETAYKEKNYCEECEAEEKQKEAIRLKKQTKTVVTVFGIVAGVILLILIACFVFGHISDRREKANEYDLAISYYEEGKYDKAIKKLSTLGSFKDSDEKIAEVKTKAYEREHGLGEEAEKNGELEKALSHYEAADKYNDADERIYKVILLLGTEYLKSKEYEEATKSFEKANEIQNLEGKDLANFNLARALLNIEKGDSALKRANETLSGFNYRKAITDSAEYSDLFSATATTRDAVEYYEDADKIAPGIKGLNSKISATRAKHSSLKTRLSKLEKARSAEAARLEKARAAEAARAALEAGALARKLYAGTLREYYLDNAMNVYVNVSGRHNTHIKLTFSLFNEVWAHNFEKGDQFQEMRNLGFEKITLSNGYDWRMWWDLG